jgi:hypothetical protein
MGLVKRVGLACLLVLLLATPASAALYVPSRGTVIRAAIVWVALSVLVMALGLFLTAHMEVEEEQLRSLRRRRGAADR